MITPLQAFTAVPAGLRGLLVAEYDSVVRRYAERKWRAGELNPAPFCEIVYTILDGHAKGEYAAGPIRPVDFAQACRELEAYPDVPRSFRSLIPRMLSTLYDLRGERSAVPAGRDVDPTPMDACLILNMVNWIMAELVRIFHQMLIGEARRLVESLVDRRVPLVWIPGEMRRVLDPTIKPADRVLILAASCPGPVGTDDLFGWSEFPDRKSFDRTLRDLHNARRVEVSMGGLTVQILPPGAKYIDEMILAKYAGPIEPEDGRTGEPRQAA